MNIKFNLDRYCRSLEEESNLVLPYSYCSLEEDSIEKPFAKEKWAFVRLYNSVYPDKDKTFGGILRKFNMLISDKAIDNKFYTHANINYRLVDQYFGLNLDSLDQKEAVYVESIMNEKKSDKTILVDKSTYSVYGIKISNLEHKNLKLQLEKLRNGSMYKYDVLSFITTATLLTKNKIKNIFIKNGINDETKNEFADLSNIKKGLVCSTFVAFILKNTSSEINKWMYDNKKSVYEFAPNTLTKIPGMTYLFGGNFLTYDADYKKFVKENPAFKEYMK